MMKPLMAVLAVASLASCQSVESRHVDFGSNATPNGLHYAAPKALMTVELIEQDGQFSLGVSRPFLVGDPEATYTLNASSGLFANQKYRFMVNPQTRLLTYINSVSEGQGLQILSNLARSVGAIGALPSRENSAGAGPEIRLFSKVIDPFEYANCDFAKACTLTALNKELHARALEFLGCSMPEPRRYPEQCQRIAGNPDYFLITLDPVFTIERGSRNTGGAAASACSNSICYRAPAPYRMGVRVAGVRDVSEIVMLPNESPVMSMSLPAGVFATSRSRVELVQGMPATVVVDQGNELVGITAIPLTVINGFFSAVSEVFQLRINYDTRQINLLKADQARQKAQDEYDAAQKARQEAIEASIQAELAKRNNSPNLAALTNEAEVRRQAANEAEASANASADVASRLSATPDGAAPENSLLGKNSGSVDPLTDSAQIDLADAQKAVITTVPSPAPRLFEVPLWKPAQDSGRRVGTQPATGAALDGGSPS